MIHDAPQKKRVRHDADKPIERRSVRGTKEKVLLFIILAAAVLVVILVIYNTFFTVKEITVEGASFYTSEEIIKASGLKTGERLFSYIGSDAKDAIADKCRRIGSVSISCHIPDKLTIIVSEDKPTFYAYVLDECYTFSQELRLIDIKADAGDTSGMIKLGLPAIKSAKAGGEVEFFSELRGLDVKTTVDALTSSALYESGRISSIDFTDYLSITMVCDAKYLMKFGACDDMDIKLKLASEVLKDAMFETGNKAIIDLSDTSETSVIIDNTLVFD